MLERVQIIPAASTSGDAVTAQREKSWSCSSVVPINLPHMDAKGAVVGFVLQQLLSCRSLLLGVKRSISGTSRAGSKEKSTFPMVCASHFLLSWGFFAT